TTIIISIATITLIATLIAKAAIGSTIRNIVETRPMGTGKRRINSVVKELVAQVVTDPVVEELEIAPVEVDLLIVLVVEALAIVPAAAELETDPVVAGL